eukprot:TRINITY_DN42993_c0_g1_i1.p1 TRINITY_DN42993_c0_g1~~TRINITY_DN42993_c0_g1_i1.p1  ORF type:complete len:984 (-),score=122.46 TRINITY_DN42993_c0_g1_i1:374-3325(-)
MPRPPKVSPAEHYAKASDLMLFLANVEEPIAGRQNVVAAGRRTPSQPGRCEHPQLQRQHEAADTCPSCGNRYAADATFCRRCGEKRQRGASQQPSARRQHHQQPPCASSPPKSSQHAQQPPSHQCQQPMQQLELSHHPEAVRPQECLPKPLQHASSQQEPQVRLVQYQSASQLPVQYSSQPKQQNLAAAENNCRLPLRRPGAMAQNLPAHAASQYMPYMLGPCLQQADQSPLRGQRSPTSPLHVLQQTFNSSVVRQRSAPSPPLQHQVDMLTVTRQADQSAVVRQHSSSSPMAVTPRDANLGFSAPMSPQTACCPYSSPLRSNSFFSPPARGKTSPDRQVISLSRAQSVPHHRPDIATSTPVPSVGSRAKASPLQQRVVVQPPQAVAGLLGSGPCDHTTPDHRACSNEMEFHVTSNGSVDNLLDPSIHYLTNCMVHDSELVSPNANCRDDPILPVEDTPTRHGVSTPMPSPGSCARGVMPPRSVAGSPADSYWSGMCSGVYPICTPAVDPVTSRACRIIGAANVLHEDVLSAADACDMSVSDVEVAESFAHVTPLDASDSQAHEEIVVIVNTASSSDTHGLNDDSQQIKHSSGNDEQRDNCADYKILPSSCDADKLVNDSSNDASHEQQQQAELPDDEDPGAMQAELPSVTEKLQVPVQDASADVSDHCGNSLVRSRIFTFENMQFASSETTGSDAEKCPSSSLDSCTDDETWTQLRSQLRSLHQSVHDIASRRCFLAEFEVDNDLRQNNTDAKQNCQRETLADPQRLPEAWPALEIKQRIDPKQTCQQEQRFELQEIPPRLSCIPSVPGSKAAAQLLETSVPEQAIAFRDAESFAPQVPQALRDARACQPKQLICTSSDISGEVGSRGKPDSPAEGFTGGGPVYPTARELAPTVPFGNHSLERTDAMARLRRALHSKARSGHARSSSLSGASRSSSRLQPSQAKALPSEPKKRSGSSSTAKASCDPFQAQSAMAQLWLPQPR